MSVSPCTCVFDKSNISAVVQIARRTNVNSDSVTRKKFSLVRLLPGLQIRIAGIFAQNFRLTVRDVSLIPWIENYQISKIWLFLLSLNRVHCIN